MPVFTDKHMDLCGFLDEQLAVAAAQKKAEEAASYSDANYDRANAAELARYDLNFLAGLAIPGIFEYFFPPVLLAAWALLCDSVADITKNPKIALGIPRGHAKTTLLKLFVLYIILFTKEPFILITSDIEDKAEHFLSDVVDMLDEPNIIAVFGDWKINRMTKRTNLIVFDFNGRTIVVGAIGAEGSVRGLNIKNSRPTVMIMDDIQTAECAESQNQSDTLLRWMIGTLMKARSPKGCLYAFAGNMYRTPWSILKKLKVNRSWTKFISGAILADGSVLWPAHRSFESLIEELDDNIAMGHPEIFFSEVLNDTESGVNTKIDFAKIRDWPWQDMDTPQGKFIVIDPSANKKGGDAVAIGYFEVYDAMPGLRVVIEENLSPGDTIRRALLLALQHNVKFIAVEGTAYQATLVYWFEQIINQLGITGIEFGELHSTYTSKNARITDMLKALTAGQLHIHNSVRAQVLHQISNWNPLKRDNVDGILDLLAYAYKTIELYGASIATEANLDFSQLNEVGVSEGAWAF